MNADLMRLIWDSVAEISGKAEVLDDLVEWLQDEKAWADMRTLSEKTHECGDDYWEGRKDQRLDTWRHIEELLRLGRSRDD